MTQPPSPFCGNANLSPKVFDAEPHEPPFGQREPALVRAHLQRTSAGWVRLPPPGDCQPESPESAEELADQKEPGLQPRARQVSLGLQHAGLRRRESWLKWWPEHAFSEGSMQFCQSASNPVLHHSHVLQLVVHQRRFKDLAHGVDGCCTGARI